MRIVFFNYSLLLLVAIITLGCSNESSTKNSTESIKLKNKFIPIINGYWVESSYIDSISITKSPCKSANAVKPIVELFIDCAKINGDSILVAAPSIHEGGYLFYVHLRTDITKKGLLITSEFETDESFYKELDFVITKKDTMLVINSYNKDKKIINRLFFKRVIKNEIGAVQYTINKLLFEGNYNCMDTLGNITPANFTATGKVNGIANYTHFAIETDFVAYPYEADDAILFSVTNDDKEKPIWLYYKITPTGIEIYAQNYNQEKELFENHQTVYTLVKTNNSAH